MLQLLVASMWPQWRVMGIPNGHGADPITDESVGWLGEEARDVPDVLRASQMQPANT
jgi:hypothetical protein